MLLIQDAIACLFIWLTYWLKNLYAIIIFNWNNIWNKSWLKILVIYFCWVTILMFIIKNLPSEKSIQEYRFCYNIPSWHYCNKDSRAFSLHPLLCYFYHLSYALMNWIDEIVDWNFISVHQHNETRIKWSKSCK